MSSSLSHVIVTASSTIDRCLEKKWVRLLVSISVAGILVFLMTFSDKIAPFDDDWAISEALSGRFPDSGLCLFVNAFLSHIVLALNEAFPALNWFIVIERVLAFLACSAFNYALFSFTPSALAFLLVAGVEYFFIPYMTYFGNFTFIASMCTIAGGAILVGEMRSKIRPGIAYTILGIVLCVCGFLVRSNAFFLSLPFLGLAYVYQVLRLSFSNGSQTKKGLAFTRSVPIIAVFILVIVAGSYNTYAWSQPGWAEWNEYNTYRAQISDFPMPAYSDVADQMTDAGVSEEAYALATNWATADPEMFTIEKMAAIASVSRVNSLDQILEGLVTYPMNIGDHLRIVAFFCAVVVVAIFLGRKKDWIGIGIAVVFAYGLCSLFFGMERLLDRIEYPIYMYAASSIALIIGKDVRPCHSKQKCNLIRAGISLFTCCILVFMTCYEIYNASRSFNPAQMQKSISQEDYQPSSPMMDYVMAENDNIYVWGTLSHVAFEGIYEQKYLPTNQFLEKNLSVGGWITNAPFINARNDLAGMPNVIKGLAENDNAYFVTLFDGMGNIIYNYLKSEYYPDLTFEVVDEIDGYKIYKFDSQQ